MKKRIYLLALLAALLVAVGAHAQYPIMEMIAQKVIEKYQQSTCEQLWQEKNAPKPPLEEDAIKTLRSNPQMRTAFINKIAAPVANKMFECGMIP